jgi:hypothetical protein
MHSYILGAGAVGSRFAAKIARAGFATNLNILVFILPAFLIGSVPALAAVEQCRFIQAKPEREACYQRQEAELAARRKPEPTVGDTTTLDSLRQMRQEDDEVYKSLRSICRGC